MDQPLVFQQLGVPKMKCDFSEPLVLAALPPEIIATVLFTFRKDSRVKLLTLTWDNGDSATFYPQSILKDGDTLLSAEEVLRPAKDISVTSEYEAEVFLPGSKTTPN